MLKIFSSVKEVVLTDREKMLKALKGNTVCRAINSDLKESLIDNDDGKGIITRIWINPRNQTCFNFGYFTYQDIYDWIEGKGKIVKGGTDEEKLKFWEVAVFISENSYGWSIGYNMKHFKYIDETYSPERISGIDNLGVKTPLKITKKNHAEIISKVFGNICAFYGNTYDKPEKTSVYLSRMRDELIGVKSTLHSLGVGYYGAVNTPEEPENLSWVASLCIDKAAYLYYVKNNIKLPDFEFVFENQHTK